MEYRTLGRTGRRVSEIACGTCQAFDVPGERGRAAVLALMRANLREGVNLFDSAPRYGLSEANIGAAVPHLSPSGGVEGGVEGGADGGNGDGGNGDGGNGDGGNGDGGNGEYRIATKVSETSPAGVERQFAHSLSLVGGRVDLLQIHNMAGWREVLPCLAELKAQGRIRATGVTHYQPSAFGEIEAAMRTGLADTIQVPYNLLEREVERRLLPLAAEMNLGVLVMTPICPLFRRGSLIGRLADLDLEPFRPFGVRDAGGLCLKWLLGKHPDLVLLPATSRLERVAGNTAVSGAPPLPPELMRDLERRFA